MKMLVTYDIVQNLGGTIKYIQFIYIYSFLN